MKKINPLLTTLVTTIAILPMAKAAVVVSDFQFNTSGDLEGWSALDNITGLSATGQYLTGTASTGDPRLARLSLNATTTEGWDKIIFRVRETEPTGGPFFVDPFSSSGLAFVANGNAGTFTGSPVTITGAVTAVDSGDGFFTVTKDISSFGTTAINQLRLDPIGAGDAAGNFFEVDYIQITQVPEPSASLLGALGTLCLLRRRR